MEFIPTEASYGPSGEANIAVIGQQLQIVFTANNEIVNLPISVLPPHVPSAKKLPANKKYFVSVNGKRDGLSIFVPMTGSVVAKFIGFKKARNQPIAMPQRPRKVEGVNREGGTYTKDWLEFTAICEVIDAPYTGLEIGVKLRYYFGEGANGLVGIKGQGKHSLKLARFLEVITGDSSKVRVPFSDNVLPALEALLLEIGHPFMIVMANGFADAFGEAASSYLKKTSGTKVAAKKSAKKAAPKKK